MASRRQVALENSAKIDLGKLPSLWERALLADVSELQCGYAFKSKWFSDSGIRLLRGTNIIPGGLRWEDIAYLPEERILEFSDYRLEQDDIVIAMDRPLISSGLKIARLSAEDLPALLLQRVGRFKMTQAMLSDYLLIFLRSWIFITHIGGQATGTQLPHISATDIKTAPIPLPPLNEQHRIVAKIETLTTRSRKARAALDTIPPLLDQFRQSVLAAAFRGDLTADWRVQNPDVEPAEKLLERIRKERQTRWEAAELEKMKAKGKVPKNDKWKEKYPEPEPLDNSLLPDLPEHWRWVKWEDIGLCQNGRAFPSKEYSSTGTKLLRPGNLHISGKLEWTESNTRYMPDKWEKDFPNYVIGPHELVINLTAQSLADEFLGRVCLTSDKEHCLLNQRIARLTPAIISTRFCLWLFKSAFFRKYVDELNTGSLIQHMFASQIDQFVFPLPPLKEQVAIIKIVEAQVARIEKIQILRQRMDKEIPTLDQSILAKAFRGQLVPQDPNDEPASVLLERIRAEREKLEKKEKGGKRKRVKSE